MFTEKVNQLIESLETQELHATSGILSTALYAELFAAYLFKDDLTNARFLWKRIPTAVKNNAAEPAVIELQHIWSVFQALWLNDTPAFFAAVQWRWTLSTVAELMAELQHRVRRETIELIALAYSSIFEDHLQQLVQQEPAAVEEMCKSLGWSIEEGPAPRLVLPKRQAIDEVAGVDAEQQLAKLTDFVSFLEN